MQDLYDKIHRLETERDDLDRHNIMVPKDEARALVNLLTALEGQEAYQLEMSLRAYLGDKETDCPTCKGAATFTEDKWSYGDGRGRGEGHYTVDHKCPCCKGEGVFPSALEAEVHKGHDVSEHEGPGEPPEPDIDDRDHYKEDED